MKYLSWNNTNMTSNTFIFMLIQDNTVSNTVGHTCLQQPENMEAL